MTTDFQLDLTDFFFLSVLSYMIGNIGGPRTKKRAFSKLISGITVELKPRVGFIRSWK